MGGGFIYNKLFFSFYNIGSIKAHKNINFYRSKNLNIKGINNTNYSKKLINNFNNSFLSKYIEILNNKAIKNISNKFLYFKNSNGKVMYNNFFPKRLLYFSIFEEYFNKSILVNKKIYENYKLDRNFIYNNYFKNMLFNKKVYQNYKHNSKAIYNNLFKNKKVYIYNKTLLNKVNYLKKVYNNKNYKDISIFENKQNYLDNIKSLCYKSLINIDKFKNNYININNFRNISKYFKENSKISSTNTDIKKQRLYNETYKKTQLERTKDLDYDYIFDKIKDMIFEEIIFMCDIK